MIGYPHVLHPKIGKRKEVQQSLLNDKTLKDFDALATVELYIYEHLYTSRSTVIPQIS